MVSFFAMFELLVIIGLLCCIYVLIKKDVKESKKK